VLNSRESFGPLYQAMKAKTMSALDSLPAEVLVRQPTVAAVRVADGNQVRAALCEYRGKDITLVDGATWENVG